MVQPLSGAGHLARRAGLHGGESLLPLGLTLAIAAVGWREVWGAAGLALALVFAPLLLLLLREAPDGQRALAAGHANPDTLAQARPTGEGWTRGRVLRDPLFYALVPDIMGPPAIGTLFIFHQANLAELKGWDLTTFTAFFPVLSLTGAGSALLGGFLVDRLGAWRLMPFVLVPLATAALVVGSLSPVWAIPLLFLGMGMTQGLMNPVTGALWAELYGTAHLGAIRSLVTAALVAASALGPGIAGALIDTGVEIDAQAWGYAAWCLLWAGTYFALRGALRRRSEALS